MDVQAKEEVTFLAGKKEDNFLAGQCRTSTAGDRTSQQHLADSVTNEAMDTIQCHYLIGCNPVYDFL